MPTTSKQVSHILGRSMQLQWINLIKLLLWAFFQQAIISFCIDLRRKVGLHCYDNIFDVLAGSVHPFFINLSNSQPFNAVLTVCNYASIGRRSFSSESHDPNLEGGRYRPDNESHLALLRVITQC